MLNKQRLIDCHGFKWPRHVTSLALKAYIACSARARSDVNTVVGKRCLYNSNRKAPLGRISGEYARTESRLNMACMETEQLQQQQSTYFFC